MTVRSPLLVRTIRTQPYLYSAVCKTRMFYSRRIAGAHTREVFRRHHRLFAMNAFESRQVASLRTQGCALAPDFFTRELTNRLFVQADAAFRSLQIDLHRAYTVQGGERASLAGLSYEELEATEKMIALRDPLALIPELAKAAFHESILKIAANFLGCVPPLYRVMVVRDFPHDRPLHSSNFHKDNDESDSLQIFIYLVDIDGTCGPLVYIPGSNQYDVRSCRPRLSRDLGLPANDGRLSDEEVERVYPRDTWSVLHTGRGSMAAIHGNGIHKGPAWAKPGDSANRARTAIRLDLHGYKSGVARDQRENRMPHAVWDGMSELQRLFAHATFIESVESSAASEKAVALAAGA
jgi:hypothetical protein